MRACFCLHAYTHFSCVWVRADRRRIKTKAFNDSYNHRVGLNWVEVWPNEGMSCVSFMLCCCCGCFCFANQMHLASFFPFYQSDFPCYLFISMELRVRLCAPVQQAFGVLKRYVRNSYGDYHSFVPPYTIFHGVTAAAAIATKVSDGNNSHRKKRVWKLRVYSCSFGYLLFFWSLYYALRVCVCVSFTLSHL